MPQSGRRLVAAGQEVAQPRELRAARPRSPPARGRARDRRRDARVDLRLRRREPEAERIARVVALRDAVVLRRPGLRPSLVATRDRSITRPQALDVYRETSAAGLRWWSIFESLWTNYTLFERAGPRLALRGVRALSLDDTVVAEAAEYLGLPS
jgi:hypothetical protein